MNNDFGRTHHGKAHDRVAVACRLHIHALAIGGFKTFQVDQDKSTGTVLILHPDDIVPSQRARALVAIRPCLLCD